jgi:DNA polymerase III subunit gamma/tau
MSLYHKHRPNKLEDIFGNETTITNIQSDFSKDAENRPHAILITGSVGCGKTTVSRCIKNVLGCSDSDFHEVNSSDFRGIDTIREIRHQSRFKSLKGLLKVWLIDECHNLTNDAQNAFLKLLEDTPLHCYFILATTDPQKLLATIRSRCTAYHMLPLEDEDMSRLLRRIVKSEEADVPKKVIEHIVQDSQGSPRNALQILDQVISLDPAKMLKVARHVAEEQSQTIELCRALFKRRPWSEVSKILQGLKGQDAEKLRLAVYGYAAAVLIKNDNKWAAAIMTEMSQPFFNTGFNGFVYACYCIIK